MDRETRDFLLLRRLLERLPFPQTDTWNLGEHRQAAYALLSLDYNARSMQFSTCPDGLTANEVRSSNTAAEPSAADGEATRVDYSSLDRKHTDILILTPLVKELLPGLVALDVDPLRDEDENIDGYRVFRTTLQLDSTDDTLAVTITSIGAARNVPAALDTSDFILHFQPREAVIMAGIGGGVKKKVRLGDVVLAKHIIDVEGGRQQIDGTTPRYEHFDIPRPIIQHAGYYNPSLNFGAERRKVLLEIAEKLRDMEFNVPTENILAKQALEFDGGHVVAGEKLIADGSLPNYLKSLDDRIRACDMEGSGFAQACIKRAVQFLLFRGISDFGDPKKTDRWQAVAAAFAMYDVKSFLQSQFRRKTDVSSLN